MATCTGRAGGSATTWIELDLPAVSRNCALIIGDTGTPLMAVVKGDAYGHGAVQVGRAALAGGASWLGVARYGEARELREAGIRAPVLVMGPVTADEVDQAIAAEVTLTLHSRPSLELFAARVRAAGRSLAVHLKVDTGMGRLGVFAEEAVPFARQAALAGGLRLDGLFSHLAVADQLHPLNQVQLERFKGAVRAMEEARLRPRWVHLANSAAAFHLPEARYDLVRVGNVVLGIRIRIDQPLDPKYRPVLAWKARLASCRMLPPGWGVGYGQTYCATGDELVGVVPVGYGDGLRRVPGNRVLIGGASCPVLGQPCLDQLMVRLPRPFPEGEEVVIIGAQGGAAIGLHDLAALYGTSQVDIATHLHPRVLRLF
ncbi:MAG: alanine racemase [Holophaga sp.]|nr:alanine racemase [Holophaga sp.]